MPGKSCVYRVMLGGLNTQMVETSNGLLWFHPTNIGRLSHRNSHALRTAGSGSSCPKLLVTIAPVTASGMFASVRLA